MRATTMPVYSMLALLLAGALTVPESGLIGCSPAQGKIPQQLTIFYSNETENELYRCGCKSNQKGGLARRASVIATKEGNPELLVDAGNFSAKRPGNQYEEFKQSYLLKVYDLLGYSALNVGASEFNRGKKLLLQLAEQTGNRLISANVVDQDDNLVLPPYRIVEIEGLKIGIIGLMSENFRPNTADPADALKTTDPIEAFGKVWDEVRRKSDMQLLLSQLRDDEVAVLTKAYPDLDLVIGGPSWNQATQMKPWEENGTVHAKVGVRGQFLGQVDLDLDATDRRHIRISSFGGMVHALGDNIPENIEVEKVLEEFKERLRKGEVIQDVYDAHTADQQFGYAGAVFCQECHGSIYAGWLGTRHAQAYQTLASKGEHLNPGCLECHTVGYAEPGGYANKNNSYLLANVQCESCHGPGADHMVVAQQFHDGKLATRPTDWKIAETMTSQATCVACHNQDNDPHWVGDVWPYQQMVSHIACSQWLQPQQALPGAADPHAQPGSAIQQARPQAAIDAPATPPKSGQ